MQSWRPPVRWAARGVVALWLPYAALNAVFPGPAMTYAAGLALAGVALLTLRLAGVSAGECGLRLARPSRAGAGVLALLLLFIPAALALGRGQPWDWVGALVYAPASALGQELYFRGALLAALTKLGHGPGRAVLGQAALFALWHVRAFRVVPPWQALVVLAATFVAGALWGWQARRDGTVCYAAAEHALFLIVQ